jgi:hypothetical protein
VLCSSMWRYVGCLLMLCTVALDRGHAAGLSPRCVDPPSNSAPFFAAEQAQTAPTAVETSIWKTITVGGSKGVNAIREAMETAPCRIQIGDDANEILGRQAFPFIKKPVELDLVVLSVFELGFGDRDSRKAVQVPLHEIYARAAALGFDLCPAEVGPALRLNYLDQPLGEFLHIAMKPVARYTGELVSFTVGAGGAELLLIGGSGDPDVMYPAVVRFVFVRPRADTIVSGAPRENAESLAKR